MAKTLAPAPSRIWMISGSKCAMDNKKEMKGDSSWSKIAKGCWTYAETLAWQKKILECRAARVGVPSGWKTRQVLSLKYIQSQKLSFKWWWLSPWSGFGKIRYHWGNYATKQAKTPPNGKKHFFPETAEILVIRSSQVYVFESLHKFVRVVSASYRSASLVRFLHCTLACTPSDLVECWGRTTLWQRCLLSTKYALCLEQRIWTDLICFPCVPAKMLHFTWTDLDAFWAFAESLVPVLFCTKAAHLHPVRQLLSLPDRCLGLQLCYVDLRRAV